MSNYWEEQQLKQMGMSSMIEQSETKPDPKFGEPALEKTLENVKKTLWDVERHTSETQSRLDKNNQSGPSNPLYKIAKWSDNKWILDMISETLVEMQDTLENSAIARKSPSPLEKSIASLQKSSVSFNEKTLRWHDDQTNLMVKGSDPRVQAAKLKPAPSADNEMVTEKKMNLGVLAGFLEEISKGMKLVVHRLYNADKTSAEDKMEGNLTALQAAKEEKKQTGFLASIWKDGKEKAKKNWFAENWKMILAGLIFLFAPLKWIGKIWELVKVSWDFTKKHPLVAAILALSAYFFGGAFIKAIGVLIGGKIAKGFGGLKNLGKTFFQKRGMGMAGHMTDAQKKMTQTRMAGKGQLLSQRLGTAAGKTKVVAKSVGTKMGSMASSTKGIFSSLVKKFGSAGKWIGRLGSKLIMPLVTTPVGWAILAGLAIGGLIYTFWDDIKSGISKAFGFLTGAIDSIKDKFASMDISGWMKKMIKNMPWPISKLASLFGASKAEAAEDEPVKPKTPEDANKKSLSLASTSAYTSPTQGQGMGSDDFIDIPGSKVEKVLPIWKEAVKAKKESEALDKAGKFNTPEAEAARERSQKLFREANKLAREGGVTISDETADDKATVIPTPPEGEPSKWLPFGHDKSAFKKQTSLGDRWKNFSKKMWGGGEEDEGTGAEETSAKPPIKAVRTPARKSFHVKKTLRKVLVTSKMKKLWGESQGIYQKGKAGKRAQLRSAEQDLKKKLARGDTEEIKKVLGPELYTQMVQHSNVNDLSPAVSPNKQMETMTGVHEEKAALGSNQAPPPSVIASDSRQTIIQENPLTWVSPPQTRNKTIITSR